MALWTLQTLSTLNVKTGYIFEFKNINWIKIQSNI